MTRVIFIDQLDVASAALGTGQVVALPTETVYGLAARAEDETAVRAIFALKRRPMDNPLIVHAAHTEMAFGLADAVPDFARELARTFWPGPLSLVVDSAVDWPWVQAGHTTLALRVPSPRWLRGLIADVGPLAAPSANRSGRPSPTTAAHVLSDLDGEVPLVVDGGPCQEGLESTVVDCTGPAPRVLRPGPITAEQIAGVLGEVGNIAEETGVGHGVSPGTRHRHYQPQARVRVVDDLAALTPEPATLYIGPAEAAFPHGMPPESQRTWGSVQDLAARLYAWFREADALGMRAVVIQAVPPTGLGAAVMNRLDKAAEG